MQIRRPRLLLPSNPHPHPPNSLPCAQGGHQRRLFRLLPPRACGQSPSAAQAPLRAAPRRAFAGAPCARRRTMLTRSEVVGGNGVSHVRSGTRGLALSGGPGHAKGANAHRRIAPEGGWAAGRSGLASAAAYDTHGALIRRRVYVLQKGQSERSAIIRQPVSAWVRPQPSPGGHP